MLRNYTAKYTKISSGYMGQMVEWPEVITEGKTLEECRELLKDALHQMVLAYRQQGKGIPKVSRKTGGNKHIPALKFEFLTPFYDFFIRTFMREKLFKNALIGQANIRPGHKVLDFGCGTGTLTIMAKTKNPDASVVGVDIDDKIIGIARNKIATRKLDISIDKYDGSSLPYEEQSFDRVLSSLVFHHLTGEQKEHILKELYRILKASGEIHLADIGKPRNALMRGVSFILGLLEPTITDNIRGLIPDYLKAAGFLDVRENGYHNTIFGSLSLYGGRKP